MGSWMIERMPEPPMLRAVGAATPTSADLDAFAASAGARLVRVMPGYREDPLERTELNGVAVAIRRFSWTPNGGTSVRQVQLCKVVDGFGYIATATLDADANEDRERLLVADFVSTRRPPARSDAGQALDPAGWSSARAAWTQQDAASDAEPLAGFAYSLEELTAIAQLVGEELFPGTDDDAAPIPSSVRPRLLEAARRSLVARGVLVAEPQAAPTLLEPHRTLMRIALRPPALVSVERRDPGRRETRLFYVAPDLTVDQAVVSTGIYRLIGFPTSMLVSVLVRFTVIGSGGPARSATARCLHLQGDNLVSGEVTWHPDQEDVRERLLRILPGAALQSEAT